MHKQRLLFFLLFFLSFNSIMGQIRMGIIAGPAFTTNTLNNVQIGVINPSIPCFCGVKQIATKPTLTYSAGFTLDYAFSDQFSIYTKTLFSVKGWNENVRYTDFNSGNAQVSYDSKDKYRFNYFEVPIYFVFSSSLGNEGVVFHVGFGGYLDVAMAGKYQFHLTGAKNIIDNSGTLTENAFEDGLPVLRDSSNFIAISSLQQKLTNYHANSLDIGASALLAVEMGNGFHYDLSFLNGFRNVLTNGFYPYPRTNRIIAMEISAGYYFGKK
jgi:hypothetical protein